MTQTQPPQKIGRRRFLLGAWGVALTAMLGETGFALLKLAQPIMGEGAFGGRIRAGRVDEFQVGSVSFVRTGRFFLVRLDEGFLALSQTCTHLGCSVPWVAEEGQFKCPCHGSVFTTVGEVVGGPAPRPLDTFPVEIVSGEVFVDTGQRTQRAAFDISQVARV